MRKFARQSNAIDPSSLCGTILRKHIATQCVQLNLTDVDVSDLATFIGHAENIHRQDYRQPLTTRDILKISQYLEAVQGNTLDASDSSSDSEDKDSDDKKFNDKTNTNHKDVSLSKYIDFTYENS